MISPQKLKTVYSMADLREGPGTALSPLAILRSTKDFSIDTKM